MQLIAQVSGDHAAFLQGERTRLAEAITAAVNGAALGLRDDVRTQVRSKFRGNRLEKAVRARTYPEGRHSVGAAGLVYIAAKWITTHIEGATITAADGHYLAIPLPAAEARGYDRQEVDRSSFGRYLPGSGAGNAMISAAVRDFGQLVFLPGAGGGVLAARTKGGMIPLFALKRQVRLKPSLDVATLAADWLRRLGDDIATRLAEGG